MALTGMEFALLRYLALGNLPALDATDLQILENMRQLGFVGCRGSQWKLTIAGLRALAHQIVSGNPLEATMAKS